MEMLKLKNEKLPIAGGYNKAGELTNDPAEIIETRRTLPIGYWKGAGMSIMLDVFAAILTGGLAGHEITKSKIETDISQVFISIDVSKLSNHSFITKTLEGIIEDYQQSVKSDPSQKMTYPGERVLNSRKRNTANGIPVLKNVWDKIMAL
jgi:3-dehydro-L-gulonate 2-dehydrogenase